CMKSLSGSTGAQASRGTAWIMLSDCKRDACAPVRRPLRLRLEIQDHPGARSTKPRYKSGFGEVFGGCSHIEKSTLTSGAPANTRGITYVGNPPFLKANMMQRAPAAPSAPPISADVEPFIVNPC